MTTTIGQAEKARARKILKILRKTLPVRTEDFATLTIARESPDPFRILVVTILTQNCTDKAALRAYRSLDKKMQITPLALSRARTRGIARTIRAAGLYKQKAKGLKMLSKIITREYSGSLEAILEKPLDQARVLLQQLPHVGPKTADVLLGVLGQPTISVDTHVNRVSKRLGLAPEKGRYEEVRTALMRLYRTADYASVPLLFMAHGRKTCRAPRPRCSSCAVEKLCTYTEKAL